jgi:hypothetical protein
MHTLEQIADRLAVRKSSSPFLPNRLDVLIRALVRQSSACGCVHLLLIIGQELLVDLSGRRSQRRGSDELLNA